MNTITKRDLSERVAKSKIVEGLSQADTLAVIHAFIQAVTDELGKGNRVEFRDFGIFDSKERAPRVGRNPKTGEAVNIPARRVVRFRPGRELEARVGNYHDQA